MTSQAAATGATDTSVASTTAVAGGAGGQAVGVVLVTATETVTNVVTGTNSLGSTTTGQDVGVITVVVTAAGGSAPETVATQPSGEFCRFAIPSFDRVYAS